MSRHTLLHLRTLAAALGVAALPTAPLAAQASVVTLAQVLQRPADPTRMLSAGQSRSSALDAADAMVSDSSRIEPWYFEGRKGQRVRIRQHSAEFDTYVHLGRQGGEAMIADNDDGPDGTDSEISITLPDDGVYVVVANAYSAADLGGYSIELQVEAPEPGMDGPVTPARVMLREAKPTTRLGVGQRFASQFDAQSPAMDDGTTFELWHVTLEAGDTLMVAVETAQFAPAVHVGRQGREGVLAEGADARRAAVRVVVRESGVYTIVVRSQHPGATGNYVLELSRAGTPTP